MAGLRAKVIKDSFRSILRVDSDSGLTGVDLLQVEDGDGVDTGLSIASNRIGVDVIAEKTGAAGVTIDGVVIKDNAVTASSGFTGTLTGTASVATQAATAVTLATPRTIGGSSFNGSANIVPGTITIADEDSDTTCFPLFVTAATGDLAPKSNSDKLAFNASSGVLTASGFAGPLTGNVTGNITGNLTGTLQTAAQTNVTSLGTLTALNIDNINLNTSTMTITHASGDYSTLTTIANGVTTLSTFDNLGGVSGNINLIADGDIYLRPKPGGGVHLYDSDDSAYVPSHDRHAINKLYADTNYNPKISTPDAITSAHTGVAASLTTLNTEVTTNGDGDLDNVTLANGTSGQIKHIYCVVEGHAGDSWKITPATMCGGTIITFAATSVGLGCTMVYADNEGWVVVGNNGGTIS